MKWIFIIVVSLACCSVVCSSRKALEVITFSPIDIDKQKLSSNDYSEIITTVNTAYDGGTHHFTKADLLRDETIFMYLKLATEDPDDGCCRVTIDKNKNAIVNMQPDCPVRK